MRGGLNPTLDPERFGHRLRALAARFGPRMILGLSGGGDSMALAVLTSRVAAPLGLSVHAVVVDHGLRTGSAEEARWALAQAGRLGLAGEIATPPVPPVQATRVQASARDRRHRALADVARVQQARVVLLAHTRDDQAETCLFRLLRGSDLDGLAGMAALAASPAWADPDWLSATDAADPWPCVVARPLLDVSRAALRETLRAAEAAWVEDPANADPRFSRARVRARLCDLAGAGCDVDAAWRLAALGRRLRLAREDEARAALEAAARWNGERLHLDRARWSEAAADARARALSWIACAVGHAARTPDATKTRALADRLARPEFKGATLAGASFEAPRGGWIVARPARGRGGIVRALPPSTVVRRRLAALAGDFDAFVMN
jgi:tRNA(Ile)-lysidine synthase